LGIRVRVEIKIGDNAVLTSALLIEPVKPGMGLWRFSGEGRLRTSVEPQLWPGEA